MASSHICSCFGKLRPRYKRLVDNIFPTDPNDGLVKSNMDKLIFYALSSPEKLDRIGAYLARKLTRDVDRRRFGFVSIDVEALDQLLLACHAPNLNLFVESFLKMVQRLLECTEVDLQVMGSTSFVKFANIEEDTPSYHRRYDFFVSKFSAMCWNNEDSMSDRQRLQTAGLKGLQGVIRKTVSDDLQVNIWEASHMGKIIPSLLYVMEMGEKGSNEAAHHSDDNPANIAESCLRELMSRGSFDNIKSFITPLVTHFDNNSLWVPNAFALKVFKIILYSVQNQYNYLVIEMLLMHLDKHSEEPAKIKASIVQVLAACVEISSNNAIGPAVLEVFNTLLRHLRVSVDARFSAKKANKAMADDEAKFEESLVSTVGAFATVLPDFQKTDIMLFIMGKFPFPSSEMQENSSPGSQNASNRLSVLMPENDTVLQKMLLQCLLKVAQSFKAASLSAMLSPSFLDALLQATIVSDPAGRNLALEILYTLIDRHDNCAKLGLDGVLKSGTEVKLSLERCSKQDLIFFKKNRGHILWYLYESARKRSNLVQNYLALYLSLAVLSIELNELEMISYLTQFVFGLQTLATNRDENLPSSNRCALHGVVAAFLLLAVKLLQSKDFEKHVSSVMKLREKEAAYLLPLKSLQPDTAIQLSSHNFPKKLLFDYGQVHAALVRAGLDGTSLATPYTHKPLPEVMSVLPSPMEPSVGKGMDGNDSRPVAASPGVHPQSPKEHITFRMLKDIITEKTTRKLASSSSEVKFSEASFDEIADTVNTKAHEFQSKLSNVMEGLNTPTTNAKSLAVSQISLSSIPGDESYEVRFPTQYVY